MSHACELVGSNQACSKDYYNSRILTFFALLQASLYLTLLSSATMRLSLLLSFVFASSVSASLDLFGTTQTPFFTDASSHYGDPKDGCMPDEQMFKIQGIEGDLCTPECDASGQCPSDVPAGVTAHPMCGLSSPTGEKYCVLLCQPGVMGRGDSDCGDAKCRSVKGQPGVGICTYDISQDEIEMDGLAGAW